MLLGHQGGLGKGNTAAQGKFWREGGHGRSELKLSVMGIKSDQKSSRQKGLYAGAGWFSWL